MGQKYVPRVVGEKYIDATGLVAGRLASYVAKWALSGYRVFVVNAEKAIITGDKYTVFRIYKQKVDRGDWYKGPFYPRQPHLILKRIIRGMLPWHSWRGRVAFKRIKCYIGIPEELKGKQFETIPEAKPRFERGVVKYVTLEELSKFLGARFYKVE